MHLTIPARAGIAGVAVTGLLALPLAPAHAADAKSDAGAHFLVGQLAATGDRLQTTYDGKSYDDLGLTIDAILALDSARTGQTEADKATDYVLAHGADYTGTSGGSTYAGATAKLLVLTQAQGKSSTVGGTDLVAALKSLQQPDGQLKDKSSYGDYSNTVGQSWGVIALKRAGQNPAQAVDFLLKQQCDDGGFRVKFDDKGCTSDPDATSMAVQALAAVGNTKAVNSAVAYLAKQQNAVGGVQGGSTTAVVNSNSTGLAAVAFTLAGKSGNAAKARDFVLGLQYGCATPEVLRGGFAYDPNTKSTKDASDSDRRASAQGLLALTGGSYASVTAGGSATANALACGGPTSSPTSAPTSSSTSGAPTSSSTVSGPPVVTDGPAGGDNASVLLVGAGATAVALGGLAVAGARRRR